MFNSVQRRVAIDTFTRVDHSHSDTAEDLGCPNKHTLRYWWKEHKRTGEAPTGLSYREPKYPSKQRRKAVRAVSESEVEYFEAHQCDKNDLLRFNYSYTDRVRTARSIAQRRQFRRITLAAVNQVLPAAATWTPLSSSSSLLLLTIRYHGRC